MSRKSSTEDFVVLGWCARCKQWVEGIDSEFAWGLPDHTNRAGERCLSSGYSASEIKYRIDSLEQAQLLARIILDDTSVCLETFYDGTCHTPACGDGRNCEEERNRRAKALAQYLVDTLTV